MIKSEVIKAKKEKPFPKLMKHKDSDLMVYFSDPESGFVVVKDTDWEVGMRMDRWWDANQFQDTDDTVMLTIGG